ncbi:hypothetical protein GA0115240_12612 [Streptomyces sp. DvalAA-14]|uniref:hypothetical protein n=1 Tax=unclassified Streptomyces TaxID=2593676 RepID=UPI00081AFCB7|nr:MULTISPECIES: hypothetical protein [unclassified Streptomyces]MYS21130.1 hypothetical protein [Streptomyces sp. SID4948]SCD84956.1 hypothetical protein GA0115240_12612 [Streptomyces sp. DvalAA-14]
MTSAASPFRPKVSLSDVPAGRVLSTDDGESRQVYEIAGHPGWLAKLYKAPVPGTAPSALENLIRLPASMTPADRTLIGASVSWPVARIVDGGTVQGIVMAKAPNRFSARLRNIKGELQDFAPLPLDWLVATDAKCVKRGIRPADRAVREQAVRSLLGIGDLFARHDIVYGDWSYSNVFWEQGTGAVFVIDMDTCGIGTRKWIQSNGWEDPLFSEARKPALTVLSDRYKLAVLTVRCLTGERGDPMAAHRALVNETGSTPLSAALFLTLNARVAEQRCTPEELLAALDGRASNGRPGAASSTTPGARTNRSNVIGSRKVGPPTVAAAKAPGASQVGQSTSAATSAPSRTASNVTGSVDLSGRSRTGGTAPKTPPRTPPGRPAPVVVTPPKTTPPKTTPPKTTPPKTTPPKTTPPVAIPPAPRPTAGAPPKARLLNLVFNTLLLVVVVLAALLGSTLLFDWPL